MRLLADTSDADRLSARVRLGTREIHDAAQRSGFLGLLADGRLPREAYADLAAQHWFVYQALESAGATLAGDPVVAAFVRPELIRLPALESDLRFLHGPRWVDRIRSLPATTTYCTRLRDVAFGSTTGFVAHHYTRYVGDLSGGQYLGPAIARAYRLQGDGHRFFEFDEVDPVPFKSQYRRLLDSLPWGADEEEHFLAEVAEAYRLNIAVLDELKGRWA